MPQQNTFANGAVATDIAGNAHYIWVKNGTLWHATYDEKSQTWRNTQSIVSAGDSNYTPTSLNLVSGAKLIPTDNSDVFLPGMLAVWQGGMGNGEAHLYYSYGYYKDDGSLAWSGAKILSKSDANYANVLAYASEDIQVNQQGQSEFYVVAHRSDLEAGTQTNNNLLTASVAPLEATTNSTNNGDDTDVYYSSFKLPNSEAVSLNPSSNTLQTSSSGDNTTTATVLVSTSNSNNATSPGFWQKHSNAAVSLTLKIPIDLPFGLPQSISGLEAGEIAGVQTYNTVLMDESKLEAIDEEIRNIEKDWAVMAGNNKLILEQYEITPEEIDLFIEDTQGAVDALYKAKQEITNKAQSFWGDYFLDGRRIYKDFFVIQLSSEFGRAINDINDTTGNSKYRTKVKIGFERTLPVNVKKIWSVQSQYEGSKIDDDNSETESFLIPNSTLRRKGSRLENISLFGETTYYFDKQGNFYRQVIANDFGMTYSFLNISKYVAEYDTFLDLSFQVPATLHFDARLTPLPGTKAPLDFSFGDNSADNVWGGDFHLGLLEALGESIPILNGAMVALSKTDKYTYDAGHIGVSIDPTVIGTADMGIIKIPLVGMRSLATGSLAGDIYGGFYIPTNLFSGNADWQPSSNIILDVNATFTFDILGLIKGSFSLSTGDLIPHSNNSSAKSVANQPFALNTENTANATELLVTNTEIVSSINTDGYPGAPTTTVDNTPLTGTNNNYSGDLNLIAPVGGNSDRANDYPMKIYIPKNGNAIGIWARDNEYTNADGTINNEQTIGTTIRTQSFFGAVLSPPEIVFNQGINLEPVLGFYRLGNNNNQLAIWSHADSTNLTLNSSLDDLENALTNSDLYYSKYQPGEGWGQAQPLWNQQPGQDNQITIAPWNNQEDLSLAWVNSQTNNGIKTNQIYWSVFDGTNWTNSPTPITTTTQEISGLKFFSSGGNPALFWQEQSLASYYQEITENGPRLYLRFDDQVKATEANPNPVPVAINEINPTIAGTYSGNYQLGITGALGKDPSQALQLNPGGLVTIDYSIAQSGQGAFSVELWVKPLSSSNYDGSALITTSENNWSINLEEDYTVNFVIGNTILSSGETKLIADDWNYLLLTYVNQAEIEDNNSQYKGNAYLTINGELIASQTEVEREQFTTQTPQIIIGNNNSSVVVDELAFYGGIVSDYQAHYQAQNVDYTSQAGSTDYNLFWDESSQNWEDNFLEINPELKLEKTTLKINNPAPINIVSGNELKASEQRNLYFTNSLSPNLLGKTINRMVISDDLGNSWQLGGNLGTSRLLGVIQGGKLINPTAGNSTDFQYTVLVARGQLDFYLDTSGLENYQPSQRKYNLDYQNQNGSSLLTQQIAIAPQINGAAPGLAPAVLITDNEPTNLDQIDSGYIIKTGDNSIGQTVALGDINNNGKVELVLGAPASNQDQGGVYLLYDGTTDYDLVSATEIPSQGIWLTGIGATGASLAMTNTYRYLNATQSQLVDLDGDNLADLVIGAPQANNGNQFLTGAVYIIYGKDLKNISQGSHYDLEQDTNKIVKKIKVGFSKTVDNTKTYPENYAEFGYALALGDINGDNYADIAIGAPQYNEGAGGVYLLYGSSNGISNTTPQLILEGSTQANEGISTVGYSVAIASSFVLETVNGATGGKTYRSKNSFDGDKYGDLIIGAPNYSQEINNSWKGVASPNQSNANVPSPSDTSNVTLGRVYVMWGKNLNASSATVAENNFNQNNGIIVDALKLTNGSSSLIQGTLNNMVVGDNVASAGDLDNDGNADIALSAAEINNSKGAVFLFKGKSNGSQFKTTPYYLISENQSVGSEADAVLLGYEVSGRVGSSMNSGNFDGDLYSDLLLSAPYVVNSTGQTYLVRGQENIFDNENKFVDLSPAAQDAEFFFNGGKQGDLSGLATGIGDVNNDGYQDLLISGTGNRKAYVVYGKGYFPDGTELQLNKLSSSNGFVMKQEQIPPRLRETYNLGDINEDGYDDVLNIGGSDDPAKVILGGSNATLLSGDEAAETITFNIQDTYINLTPIEDFNGDGAADLMLITGEKKIYLILGYDSGTTTEIPQAVSVASESGKISHGTINESFGGISSPSIVFYQNAYYGAYITESGAIAISISNDGKNWNFLGLVSGQKAAATPKLTVWNDELYLIYSQVDGTNGQNLGLTYTKSSDGENWSNAARLGYTGLQDDFDVTVWNNKILVVYPNVGLMSASIDQEGWSKWQDLQSLQFPNFSGTEREGLYNPSVTSLNNTLYLVFVDNSSDKVYLSSSGDGVSWSQPSNQLNNDQSIPFSFNPMLTASEETGTLYLAYQQAGEPTLEVYKSQTGIFNWEYLSGYDLGSVGLFTLTEKDKNLYIGYFDFLTDKKNALLRIPTEASDLSSVATNSYYWVANSIGDINGDGYGDIALVDSAAESDQINQAYILLGNSQATLPNLDNLNSSQGFLITGNQGSQITQLVKAGDVNLDGIDDYLYVTQTLDPNLDSLATATITVGYGAKTGTSGHSEIVYTFNPSSRNYTQQSNFDYGFKVVAGGDIDGDSKPEIVMAYHCLINNNPQTLVEILYGDKSKENQQIVLNTSLDYNQQPNQEIKLSLDGDVNGDGYDDLVIGFPGDADEQGTINTGNIYVLFGGAAPQTLPNLPSSIPSLESGVWALDKLWVSWSDSSNNLHLGYYTPPNNINNPTWTFTNQGAVPNAHNLNDAGASLVEFQNQLYLFWVDSGDALNSSQYYLRYNTISEDDNGDFNYGTSQRVKSDGAFVSDKTSRPFATATQETLYLSWQDNTSDHRAYYASADKSNVFTVKRISGDVDSLVNPAITTATYYDNGQEKDLLIAVWKNRGQSNWQFGLTSNVSTNTWVKGGSVNDWELGGTDNFYDAGTSAPTLFTLGDSVYLFWNVNNTLKGAVAQVKELYQLFSNSNHFVGWRELPLPAITFSDANVSPSVFVSDDNGQQIIYLVNPNGNNPEPLFYTNITPPDPLTNASNMNALSQAPFALGKIGGLKESLSGSSVSNGGNINGDGYYDILTNAPQDPTFPVAFGIFGNGYFPTEINYQGTLGNDSIEGTPTGETIVADEGDDYIITNGGTDVVYAGQGDDLVTISDFNFRRLDGGSGFDTLKLTGLTNQSLDFTTVVDGISLFSRLRSFEALDLTDYGANSFTLNPLILTGLSANYTSFMITGDKADKVFYDSAAKVQSNPNSYTAVTYDDFNLVVLIDSDITVSGYLYKLVLNAEGSLVLLSASGEQVWAATNSAGEVITGAVQALMQTDGNFVLYSKAQPPQVEDNPTSPQYALWSTHTQGNAGASLQLNENGGLSLINSSGVTISTLYAGTGSPGTNASSLQKTQNLLLNQELLVFSDNLGLTAPPTSSSAVASVSVSSSSDVLLEPQTLTTNDGVETVTPDYGPAQLFVAAPSTSESESQVTFTISRSGDLSNTVVARYYTDNAQAIAGEHFQPVLGLLVFAPGESYKTVSVPLLDNHFLSGNRQFQLQLTIEDEYAGIPKEDDLAVVFNTGGHFIQNLKTHSFTKDDAKPPGVTSPLESLSFEVVPDSQGQANFTFALTGKEKFSHFWTKNSLGQWRILNNELNPVIKIIDNNEDQIPEQIQFSLIDGGQGDSDGLINGVITINSALSLIEHIIKASDSSSVLKATAKDDYLSAFGKAGTYRLEGLAGNDILTGSAQRDVLMGGEDNDQLFGYGGVDKLFGETGDDILEGGADIDFLYGGTGTDNFVLRAGDGPDRVMDFNAAEGDLFLLDNLSFGELSFNKNQILLGTDILAIAIDATGQPVTDFANHPQWFVTL